MGSLRRSVGTGRKTLYSEDWRQRQKSFGRGEGSMRVLRDPARPIAILRDGTKLFTKVLTTLVFLGCEFILSILSIYLHLSKFTYQTNGFRQLCMNYVTNWE